MDDKATAFTFSHWDDTDGNPDGGVAEGTGISIRWQQGPLGRGEERRPPNGAFVETVLGIALNRMDYYQKSRFSCAANAAAMTHILKAIDYLEMRTKQREERGVEGTHAE